MKYVIIPILRALLMLLWLLLVLSFVICYVPLRSLWEWSTAWTRGEFENFWEVNTNDGFVDSDPDKIYVNPIKYILKQPISKNQSK
jgi:hypothetical protein